MNPRSLRTWFARRLVTGGLLFLHGCHPCPAQPAPPMPPAFAPNLRTNYFAIQAVDGAGNLTTLPAGQTTVLPVSLAWNLGTAPTNYTLLVTQAGKVRSFDLGTNTAAVWPPPVPALTNHVLSVYVKIAEADTIQGPWITNTLAIFTLTNPPGAHFWQTAGMAITQTNF